MTSGKHRLCTVTLRSALAKCTAKRSTLGSGKHSVKITYAGDTSYLAASKTVKVSLKK